MIPEQPLANNLTSPALHSTLSAQCQHGEESIDKEFDPGVICLHYKIFPAPWPSLFYPITKHLNAHCADWVRRSPCEHVMCGTGESGITPLHRCVRSRIKLVDSLMNKYLHSRVQKREIGEYSNVNDIVNAPQSSNNARQQERNKHPSPIACRDIWSVILIPIILIVPT